MSAEMNTVQSYGHDDSAAINPYGTDKLKETFSNRAFSTALAIRLDCILKKCLCQCHLYERHISEINIAQIGLAQVCGSEIGATDFGTAEICPRQVSSIEIGTAKVRILRLTPWRSIWRRSLLCRSIPERSA